MEFWNFPHECLGVCKHIQTQQILPNILSVDVQKWVLRSPVPGLPGIRRTQEDLLLNSVLDGVMWHLRSECNPPESKAIGSIP